MWIRPRSPGFNLSLIFRKLLVAGCRRAARVDEPRRSAAFDVPAPVFALSAPPAALLAPLSAIRSMPLLTPNHTQLAAGK